MARCLAFSSRRAWALMVEMVMSVPPVVDLSARWSPRRPSGSDGRKRQAGRLVQHLYQLWPGPFWCVYAGGHGVLVSPVLPGGQGDGAARRALDAAHRP